MTTALPSSVATARELVDPALRQAVDRLDPAVRRVAGYHFGWVDAAGEPLAGGRGGKALRPALALLSAQLTGAPAHRGIPAAVAVELVHNFSLLHDDLMDGDTERHHRPTAWTLFGSSAAILAGDALLALASEVLLEDSSPTAAWAHRCLSAATQRLITGQSADLHFEQRLDVTRAECLAMASDKTGALLSCAASIGAVLVDASPHLVVELAEFGSHLGLAFQLVDDLLGIWGTPTSTGKPVLADLRARKKSVPVVAALTSGTDTAERLRDLYARPETLSEEELREVAALIEESGAREWTERESSRQLAEAERHLDQAAPAGPVHEQLRDIARFVTRRDL